MERPFGWSARPAREREEVRSDADSLDIRKFSRAIRREMPLVALFAILGLAIAVAYILYSTPLYRAGETILLDEQRGELLKQVSALPNAVRTDEAVQSEIEILKSDKLALEVVDRLDLTRDPDFMDSPAGLGSAGVDGVKNLLLTVAAFVLPADGAAGSD